MTLRLDNGESGALTTPLTTQTLSFIGAPNEGTNLPTFVSNHYASAPTVPANLQNAISNIDAQLFTTETAASAHISSTTVAHGFSNILAHGHTGAAGDGSKIDHGAGLTGLGDDDHTQYSLVNGTRAFTGKVAGVATVAGDPATTLTTKGYVLGLIPSMTHVTYDNVAESITGKWDFANGLTSGYIAYGSNDIYEFNTNTDNGTLRINRIGYAGGMSTHRNTTIGNGKGINIFHVNGSASSIVSQCKFYTDDDSTLVDGEDTGGNTIQLDRQVTPSSLDKGWVYFSSDGSGNPTILASYNVAAVVLYGDSFRITWTKPFASANYVTVATQEGTIVSPFDSILIGSDADIKSAADVVVTVLNSSGGQQTENVVVNLVAFGVLA